MNRIKSENAKEFVCKNTFHTPKIDGAIMQKYTIEAIVIAEKDAEERYKKEMQDLKDRAIEAHRKCCRELEGNECSFIDIEGSICDKKCTYMTEFINKFYNIEHDKIYKNKST